MEVALAELMRARVCRVVREEIAESLRRLRRHGSRGSGGDSSDSDGGKLLSSGGEASGDNGLRGNGLGGIGTDGRRGEQTLADRSSPRGPRPCLQYVYE